MVNWNPTALFVRVAPSAEAAADAGRTITNSVLTPLLNKDAEPRRTNIVYDSGDDISDSLENIIEMPDDAKLHSDLMRNSVLGTTSSSQTRSKPKPHNDSLGKAEFIL